MIMYRYTLFLPYIHSVFKVLVEGESVEYTTFLRNNEGLKRQSSPLFTFTYFWTPPPSSETSPTGIRMETYYTLW